MTFKTVARLFVEGLTMFIVAAASLFLLLYVGFGDGKRTYEAMHIEKLSAQGLYVQNTMEKYLRDGVPLKQFAGFTSLAAPLLEGDDIDALIVYDQRGRQVFSAIDKSKPKLPAPPPGLQQTTEATKVYFDPTHYQIVLPLRSRFETLGSIVVVAPNSKVLERLYNSFLPLVFLAVGLSLLFAIGAVLITARLSNAKKPWLQIAYGVTFLTMAVVVVTTLIGLYFNGVEGKARASAFTLSQRLNDIVEFKLKFNHFEGIDKAFSDYLKLNPEIREAALLLDSKVEITTDAPHGGKNWLTDSGNFEYRVDLTPADKPNYTSMIVTVPKQVAYERVARSVKNFAALFIASAFLSGIFLQVASSLQKLRRAPVKTEAKAANDDSLIIVKPVYMLAVMLDALTYSFLPKFMQEAALASGVSLGFASVPFTAYYIGFAASLIPAGVLCDRQGPKPMIIGGMILAAGSVLALALPLGIWELTALRLVSGIGQGVLIIGVQSFILAVASPEKKTQGAAIIVFGFQAGLIAGMALGSLFVNFLGPKGVFFIAGAIGAANIIYSQLLIAKTEKKAQVTTLKAAFAKLSGDLRKVITNIEFLKILTCIGMPAKAILTGVITFALPLILGQAGYRPEDIGQVVMLYGLGVLLSSGYASRYVDRTKNSEAILFIGAVVSGAGLLLVGMMGTPWLGNGVFSTVVVVFAVGIVGIAHGFINAPVVSHVGQTALATRIGANPTTTAYRFLERGGHIAGPLLMSQLFIFFGQGPSVIGGVGIAVAVLGVLFVIYRVLPQPARRLQGEPAE